MGIPGCFTRNLTRRRKTTELPAMWTVSGRAAFSPRLSWKDFTLEGAVVEHMKQVPTGSFGTVFDDPRNQTMDDQAFADLKFEHPFENDLDLQARPATTMRPPSELTWRTWASRTWC